MAVAIHNPFRRAPPPQSQPPSLPPEQSSIAVPFDAFSEDCRLAGRVEITTDRLSELLNGSAPISLTDVVVESLAGGRTVDLASLTVERDELCAVVGAGPRGDPSRRIHTRAAEVEVFVGPYRITGAVHGPPGSDPGSAGLGRRPFAALTEATITYGLGADRVSLDAPVLFVNRSLARSFRPVEVAPGVYTRRAAPPESEPAPDSPTNGPGVASR